MPANAKTVLIVDDEAVFLRTVSDGFAVYRDQVNVLTAHNGRLAAEILGRGGVDLVVTDLKMPVMDGFELIAYMSRMCPAVPVLVMTAFGTPEIEARVGEYGIAAYLDKPLDFSTLATRVLEALAQSASGHLQGIALATMLQMIELDRKTCSLVVRSDGATGRLWFRRGQLLDAELGALSGDEAVLAVVGWDHPEIEIVAGRADRPARVKMALPELLLEGFRRKDEAERAKERMQAAPTVVNGAGGSYAGPLIETIEREVVIMAAQDTLKELAAIEGFAGAAVYTPAGEPLAMLQGDSQRLKEVGVLANNVLLNAQKTSIEMGTGRGQQVHIEAERAHVFARCLNEGTDPIKSQPGKAHIHMVVVLKGDSSIGLAKMRVNSVIERLAEEFRP